ncbi:hypothetical protein [Pseudoalteromonas byunsanensis]|uniref:hypothetical protein n=1 Tax=Pseudoalteromonas byunsanensis TaxID=327939 RepID=UPI00158603B8|nr:hypothetical protein [Pseudoalteromonas byunsanensis]
MNSAAQRLHIVRLGGKTPIREPKRSGTLVAIYIGESTFSESMLLIVEESFMLLNRV